MKPAQVGAATMRASWQVATAGAHPARPMLREIRLIPVGGLRAFPPFRQATATVRRSSTRATTPTSGPLRRAAATTPTTATWATTARTWAGSTPARTSDIPSAASAIKKNRFQKRGADVRRHPAFDLLGEHRPSAIALGGEKKTDAACGGRILEKQGVAVGAAPFVQL